MIHTISDRAKGGTIVRRAALDGRTRLQRTLVQHGSRAFRRPMDGGDRRHSTGSDALSADELAGALIALAQTKDAGTREASAKRGAAFLQGQWRRSASAPDRDTGGVDR
jgi:hypothetical protein